MAHLIATVNAHRPFSCQLAANSRILAAFVAVLSATSSKFQLTYVTHLECRHCQMQILKQHVMSFLGSFQATQAAATGTQECRNSLLFQYTCYHLCNSPTLSKAHEPKLAVMYEAWHSHLHIYVPLI